MIATTVFESIIILTVSFTAGIFFYYVYIPLHSKAKKQNIEAFLAQFINFILYIWGAKIILNVSTFISDPIAILAYPSNSHAFYLAILFSSIHILYLSRRKKIDVWSLFHTFIYIFMVASFMYEFIQIVWLKSHQTLEYIGILFVLVILILLLQKRLSKRSLSLSVMIAWSFGQLILSVVLPFTTVFGYLMETWLLGIILLISVFILVVQYKRNILA